MSYKRSLFLLILFSAAAGAVLCTLAFTGPPAGIRGGYAVLITDAAVPDRTLGELLAPLEGGFGGGRISESSQWVLLDGFQGLEKIPLDEYEKRVTPFDPRNDGYAERLRSFFVRDGKRFVFIPLKSETRSGADFEKQLASALGDIPFSTEYLGFGKPLGLYALLFAAASAALILWGAVRRGGLPGYTLPCLPALAALASGGAPGLALAAALAGLGGILTEPLLELCAPGPLKKDLFKLFWLRLLSLPCFLACAAALVFFTGLSPLLALGTTTAAAGLYCYYIRFFLPLRPGDRRRFIPVSIIKPAIRSSVSAACKSASPLLPFALAAILAALLSPSLPGGPSGGASFFTGSLVTEAEYLDHAAYQASFSRRPLGYTATEQGGGDGNAFTDKAYTAYEWDDDGLISPVAAPPVTPEDIPPFPLKELMEFLGESKPPGADPHTN